MDNFDALKRYESTEVDRRTWLHVPSGTPLSTISDTHQVVEYEKRLLLRCTHHFKSDLINNMDHMRNTKLGLGDIFFLHSWTDV